RKQRVKGVAGHGQALYKGGRPWPHPLQGWPATDNPLAGATGCGQGCRASPIASRGGDVGRKGGRPLARRLPTARVAAPWQGDCRPQGAATLSPA
ncbi:hypothetical protein GW17_00047949, partial [Ensete ventricosum]